MENIIELYLDDWESHKFWTGDLSFAMKISVRNGLVSKFKCFDDTIISRDELIVSIRTSEDSEFEITRDFLINQFRRMKLSKYHFSIISDRFYLKSDEAEPFIHEFVQSFEHSNISRNRFDKYNSEIFIITL